MTIVQCLESITDWLNQKVCPRVRLKRPCDYEQGTLYDFEEVSPTAFAMFLPGNDKLPEGVPSQCPYILVQLVDGGQDLVRENDRMNVQLSFMTWNPGVHPDENGMTDEYRRTADGWKDVWGFLERTITDIENAEYLNGVRFVKEAGVKYGQFAKDGQIADTYPYFYAWTTMTVERGLNRTESAYSQLL